MQAMSVASRTPPRSLASAVPLRSHAAHARPQAGIGLHRGGNRQLNAALYRIAIVQQRHHPEAKAFLARKISEGKTPREARRALKRHLSNVVYRRLLAWANSAPSMNLLT
jgi:hypothetical protein